MKRPFTITLLLLLALAACQKKVEYPVEPHVSYQGLTYGYNADSTLDGTVTLSFGYTDGDGDLGLDDNDTLYPFGPGDPYYYNLIIDYYKWNGTTFVETPLLTWNAVFQRYDTLSFNSRIKRLSHHPNGNAISGTIDYTMVLRNPLSPDDTVQVKAHIVDRALNESNTIETEAIHF